jgi:hypothetical protein
MTMATIAIKTVRMNGGADKIELVAPYHPHFVGRARALNGQWIDSRKAWHFDPRDAERVRAACLAIFGEDPAAPTTDRVGVRLKLDEIRCDTGALFALGREVARRPGRDMRVRLGDGVVIEGGSFPRAGGSMRYPELEPRRGTVLLVRDVPRALAEAYVEEEPGAEIVEEAPPARVEETAGEAAYQHLMALSPDVRQAVLLRAIRDALSEEFAASFEEVLR